MKDIYEFFNDIAIDENECEEMEVSEIEKTRVKKALKKTIHEKKKWRNVKKNVVAASIIVCISATTFGLTFPAYAKNIPVIDDIFRFFDHDGSGLIYSGKENISGNDGTQKKETGLYYEYKKFSNEINMTKESNGIKFTVNDAIFDGKTVTLTY